MAVKVPQFISDNAARGLEYNREGKGGEGLVEQTLADARDMVRGEISEAKVRKMGPWFARHKVDMDAPANDPDNDAFPGKGAVAWLLWGGSVSGDKMDAAKWAERTVARLDREREEAENLTRAATVEKHMDTSHISIEAQLEALQASHAEAIATRDEVAAKAVEASEASKAAIAERDAKIAELTAALEKASAEKAAAEVVVAVAAAEKVSASEEAAKIAASVGVAPVESAPDAAPKATILEQYLALQGAERTAFFAKHSAEIRSALRK